jgi:hypothetical protein
LKWRYSEQSQVYEPNPLRRFTVNGNWLKVKIFLHPGSNIKALMFLQISNKEALIGKFTMQLTLAAPEVQP